MEFIVLIFWGYSIEFIDELYGYLSDILIISNTDFLGIFFFNGIFGGIYNDLCNGIFSFIGYSIEFKMIKIVNI